MNNNFNELVRLLEAGEGNLFDTPTLKRRLACFEELARGGVLTAMARDEYAAGHHHDVSYGYIPCPCDSGHLARIKKTFTDHGVKWQAICEDGSLLPLLPADLPLWKVNQEVLASFVGRHFHCALDQPQRFASGMWLLGQSGAYIARKTWKMFFAGKLTDEIADDFQRHQETSILITGIAPRYLPAKLEKQVFSLCAIFRGDGHQHMLINRSVMNEPLKLVLETRGQDNPHEIPPSMLRICRLTKMMHIFLLHSSDYYNAREGDGFLRRKILPAPTQQALCDDYCAIHTDDPKWGRTDLTKMLKKEAAAFTLKALMLEAKNPDFVKDYRAWYNNPQKVALKSKGDAPPPKREKIVEAEDLDEDSYEYDVDQGQQVVSELGIGTANAWGHIVKI
jgi:hypothetical protein